MIWGVPPFLETARWKRCRFFTHQKLQLHHWSFTAPWKMVLGRCFGHRSGGYDEQKTGLNCRVSNKFHGRNGTSWEDHDRMPSTSNGNCHQFVTFWRLTNLHFKRPKMRQVLCLGDLLERGCGGNAVTTTKKSIQWDHHTHFQPLDSSCVQVQGDPLGPLVMSLWVMAGVASVTATTQVNSSTKVYIDDRTVTCNSASNLFRMFTAWQSWSQSVGLVESVSKTRVAAARPAMAVVARRFFEGGVVQPAVKVLGAVSACARRALHSAEAARLAEAKKVIRLLACCHFLLDNHTVSSPFPRLTSGGSLAPRLGLCRIASSLPPLSRRAGFVIPLPGFGLCSWGAICTLMWCGSRAWLRPSCGFVSVLGLSLLGLGRGALVLPVCVSGWLSRGSLNSTRGPGFMSMRTLKWILLVGSLRNPLVLVSGCVSIMSGKGGGLGSSSVGLGLGGMSCFVFPSCLVITLATGFCLLLRCPWGHV